MQNLMILLAFILGYGLSAISSLGGPVSLATARRRGGWEARERYPANAPSRTRAEVGKLLAEDEQRMLNS